MSSISSVNALQASVALAERQVQQDQVRVSQDASRLDSSRAQLVADKEKLSGTQRESDKAVQPPLQAAPAVNLGSAIEKPSRAEQALPAELAAPKPQVNTLGQTVGKLINVIA